MKHPTTDVMEEDEELLKKKKSEKVLQVFILTNQFSWPETSLQLYSYIGLRKPLDTNYASKGGAKNFCCNN